jgi:hypothetical protein
MHSKALSTSLCIPAPLHMPHDGALAAAAAARCASRDDLMLGRVGRAEALSCMLQAEGADSEAGGL